MCSESKHKEILFTRIKKDPIALKAWKDKEYNLKTDIDDIILFCNYWGISSDFTYEEKWETEGKTDFKPGEIIYLKYIFDEYDDWCHWVIKVLKPFNTETINSFKDNTYDVFGHMKSLGYFEDAPIPVHEFKLNTVIVEE